MGRLYRIPAEYPCAQDYGVRGTVAAIVPYSHIEWANEEIDRLRGEVDALQNALDDLREEAWTRGERDG